MLTLIFCLQTRIRRCRSPIDHGKPVTSGVVLSFVQQLRLQLGIEIISVDIQKSSPKRIEQYPIRFESSRFHTLVDVNRSTIN